MTCKQAAAVVLVMVLLMGVVVIINLPLVVHDVKTILEFWL